MDNTRLKKGDGIKFVQINHDILYNKELSLKAKGLYCFMYSKPENWNFTTRSMASQLKESRRTIMSSIDELKVFGLLDYTKHSDGSGTYIIFTTVQKRDLGENAGAKTPRCKNATVQKRDRISNTDCSSNTDIFNNTHKGEILKISDEVRAFKEKLIKHDYVGRLGSCFVEQVEESVFIGTDRRIYTDSKSSKQIVLSTLAEIYTQLHEQNEMKKRAIPEMALG